jgi:hypothetical protein
MSIKQVATEEAMHQMCNRATNHASTRKNSLVESKKPLITALGRNPKVKTKGESRYKRLPFVASYGNGCNYAKKKTPVKQGSNPHGSAGYFSESGYIFSKSL